MKFNHTLLLVALAALLAGGVYLLFSDTKKPAAHAHEEEGAHDDHDDTESTTISAASAEKMGITVATAGSATIRESIQLSGRITLNQTKSAQVKARFAGVVRSVTKQVGDAVARGEKLATVESNESLQVYAVPSPLSGVVLERSVSVGDTAADAPMFVVADLSSLWAEFYVFAGDMGAVRRDQTIMVQTLDGTVSATGILTTIQPTAEASSQSIVARAEIDNTSGVWRPGMTVRVDVITQETPVALAVPSAAIQRLEGKSVVFVRDGDMYRAAPVTLGRTDATMTEITAGIAEGDSVVSEGSFVVKADIGKAGAEHEH